MLKMFVGNVNNVTFETSFKQTHKIMENLILTAYSPEQFAGLIKQAVKECFKELEIGTKKQHPEVLLSRKEAADMLHISLVTLNDYSKRGLLKSYIIGGRVLYKQKEVEASLGLVKTVNY